jgi:hypothetical protein
LLFAACRADDDGGPQELFDRGSAHIEEGDYSDGVALMQRILREYPDSGLAASVRRDWDYYADLLAIEAERLPSLAADDLRRLGTAVERFRDRSGHYPRSLESLVPRTFERLPLDPWGRPYVYRRQGRGYVLETLGRDGAPGGAGEDRDIRVAHGVLHNAPGSTPGR